MIESATFIFKKLVNVLINSIVSLGKGMVMVIKNAGGAMVVMQTKTKNRRKNYILTIVKKRVKEQMSQLIGR